MVLGSGERVGDRGHEPQPGADAAGLPPVLVVQHVAWEGPHRIAEALASLRLLRVEALRGEALPPPGEVSGAVFMGGPMSVHDTSRFPALASEVRWLAAAVDHDLPVLGVCLGAQLLARALGAEVHPAPAKELGWAPVEVLDQHDPLVGPLAPAAPVLHWHGEVFDLPPHVTRSPARSPRPPRPSAPAGRAGASSSTPRPTAAS